MANVLSCIRHRSVSFKWWAPHILIFLRVNILHCMRCLSGSFKWWTCCIVWGLFSMCLDYVYNLHLKSIVACVALSIQKFLAKNKTSVSTAILQPWSLFSRLSFSWNWKLWSPRWGVEVYCTLSLTLALDGGGCSAPFPGPLYCQERDLVPILQKAWCAPGPVRIGAENLASHWDSIPGSSSLYWVAVSQLILKVKNGLRRWWFESQEM